MRRILHGTDRDRDDELSSARYNFDWNRQFELSTRTSQRVPRRNLPADIYKTAEFCSMCGPKFCPMQTKVDADALTELEKFLAKEAVSS